MTSFGHDEKFNTALEDAKAQFEVVLQRADKVKRGWTNERIAQYSDGIIRMEWALDSLEKIPAVPEARELKRDIIAELKKYHLERYKLLSAWMRNKSVPHWQYEFEEWIKSFRASGIKDKNPMESSEEIWKFSMFPVHPMIKELIKAENKITINLYFYRVLHPFKTAVWFIKEILPKTFKRANLYVDKYIDL